MKKYSKLPGIVTALAMMMSFAVMPVSADSSINYLAGDHNWNLEDDTKRGFIITNNVTGGVEDSIITPASNPGTAGDKVLYLDYPEAATASGTTTVSIKIDTATKDGTPMVPNKTYQLAFDVRTVNLGETTAARINVGNTQLSANTILLKDYESPYSPVTNIGNEWTTVSGLFTVQDNNTQGTYYGIHAHAEIVQSNTVDVYLDNFRITELAALTVQSTLSNESTAMPETGSYITYTFNRALQADLTANSFTTAAPITSVDKVSDGVYKLNLGKLTKGSEYTVALNTITDCYQKVSDTITFTAVPEAMNLVSANLITGGDYEGTDAGAYPGSSQTPAQTDYIGVCEDANIAFQGSKYLKITAKKGDTTTTETQRFTELDKNGAQVGDEYVASCWVRSESAEPVSVKIEPAKFMYSANIYEPSVITGDYVSVGTEWTKVTVRFKLVNNTTLSGTGTSYGFGVGIRSYPGTIYIDNFELRKLQTPDNSNVFKALVERTANGIDLDIGLTDPTGEDQAVYFIAAKYDGTKLVDVKLVPGSVDALSTISLTGYLDGYKLFIWDSSLNPLNSTFTPLEVY